MKEAPPTRGVGVLAGIAAFVAAGVADGIVAVARAPRGSLSPRLVPLVLVHTVAVLMTVGVAWGLLVELVLAAARRVDALRPFGAWVLAGPRRWFAPDPAAAHGVVAASLALAVVVGPVFPFTLLVLQTLHSHGLMALAVTLGVVAFIAAAALLVAVLSPLIARGVRALGRWGSPGALAAFALAALIAQCVRFVWLNWPWMHALDWGAAAVELATFVGTVVAVGLLAGWRVRRGRALPRRFLAAGTVACALVFALSALTFGARQTVAATIFHRSVVTRYLAVAIQRVVDLDRDGYSALFNGGDCNDRDRRIHPGAWDVPRNGVDENCSGRDATPHSEDGDGAYAAPPAAYQAQRPSFLLISIDALRPDHMGLYGYRRPTTPNLDAFARGAARFDNAWCTSPRSLRSFASIWTARYASAVEWGDDNNYPALEASNVTLAEVLHDAGYATAMFNNSDYFSKTQGFLQGFDETRQGTGIKDEVDPTVDACAAYVRARADKPEPFFAWIHVMEPHEPYRDLTTPRDFGHGPVDRYDEEVARADLAVRRLFEAADAWNAARPDAPLVVAVIGDHGEGHGEHGVWHHSLDVHEEATRVPLLIRAPGFAPGPRRALASLMDLHPTFLNLANIPMASPTPARSLVPPLAAPAMPMTGGGWRDHLYSEVTPDGIFPQEQKALWAPPYKIIWDVRRGTWELFDLARDRAEVRNLFDERTDVARRMQQALFSWVEGTDSNRTGRLVEAARLQRPPARFGVDVRARFGDVLELLGADLPERTFARGASVRVTLYYRVLRRTAEPLWMNVHFAATDGAPLWPHFHARHYPIQGRYPTTDWMPGEILRDDVSVVVSPAVRATEMRLLFSVDSVNLTSRLAPSARGRPDRAVEIGTITVTP